MTLAPVAPDTTTPSGNRTATDSIEVFRQVSRPAPSPDLLIHVAMPSRITVVYDETCELCRHARRWLEGQRTYVPLDFLPAGTARTMERFHGVPWLGEELVVVADDGRVWVGPAAFITAMWTTRKFRGWSYRLSGDTFSGMARHFFHTLTTERGRISALLKPHSCDGDHCDIGQPPEPASVAQASAEQASTEQASTEQASTEQASKQPASERLSRHLRMSEVPTWPTLSETTTTTT